MRRPLPPCHGAENRNRGLGARAGRGRERQSPGRDAGGLLRKKPLHFFTAPGTPPLVAGRRSARPRGARAAALPKSDRTGAGYLPFFPFPLLFFAFFETNPLHFRLRFAIIL